MGEDREKEASRSKLYQSVDDDVQFREAVKQHFAAYPDDTVFQVPMLVLASAFNIKAEVADFVAAVLEHEHVRRRVREVVSTQRRMLGLELLRLKQSRRS